MFSGLRLVLAAWLLTTTMFLACSTNPTAPAPHPAPVMPFADTPAHAVDAFRWAIENRSFDSYRTLFTGDYTFAFAALDSNGTAYRTAPWTRDDELQSFVHLMSGGGTSAPASGVVLTFGTPLIANDPRSGKDDPPRRKLVTCTFHLTVQLTDASSRDVNGRIKLFVVRGDIADIPADLGRTQDAGVWYVERWEDGTDLPALTESQVVRSATWGSLKALYLAAAATAPVP